MLRLGVLLSFKTWPRPSHRCWRRVVRWIVSFVGWRAWVLGSTGWMSNVVYTWQDKRGLVNVISAALTFHLAFPQLIENAEFLFFSFNEGNTRLNTIPSLDDVHSVLVAARQIHSVQIT